MVTIYLVFPTSLTVYWKYFLCDNACLFIKSRLGYIFEKYIYMDIRVQGINSFGFFPSSNCTPIQNGLIIMVSLCNNIIKFFNTYKATVHTVEVHRWLNNFVLIAYLKTSSWVSETFLHSKLISSTYFVWYS